MMTKRPFSFPYDKSIRVILDTDCKNECDDQYCLAHILMTPRFDIKGIIAEQFDRRPGGKSEEESYQEIQKIVELMGVADSVSIYHGAVSALLDEKTAIESSGAQLIIEEAMKEDPRPLFIANIGALTNLASALLICPEIAERICVIWIGGGKYPVGGWEFNLNNDLPAARVVFASNVELWQIPIDVYTKMKVSFMELMEKVYPYGEIGKYLVENTMSYATIFKHMVDEGKIDLSKSPLNPNAKYSSAAALTRMAGEMWSLGDSPVVGLMINSTSGDFYEGDRPIGVSDAGNYIFGEQDSNQKLRNKVRVYTSIDVRFILEDMFAKFKYYYGEP